MLKAVEHSLRVMSWYENLPGDEIPPGWMWPFEDELDIWFAAVKKKNDEKYGRDSGDEESSEMMENEFAERFK